MGERSPSKINSSRRQNQKHRVKNVPQRWKKEKATLVVQLIDKQQLQTLVAEVPKQNRLEPTAGHPTSYVPPVESKTSLNEEVREGKGLEPLCLPPSLPLLPLLASFH